MFLDYYDNFKYPKNKFLEEKFQRTKIRKDFERTISQHSTLTYVSPKQKDVRTSRNRGTSCLLEKKTWKGLRGRMKRELSFPVHLSFDYSFHENSGASKYLDILVCIKMTMVIPVLTSSVWPSFVMEYYITSKNNMVYK